MLLGAEEDLEEKPALVPSLFPFVAPTLYFSTANEKGQEAGLRGSRGHRMSRRTRALSPPTRPHSPAAASLCSTVELLPVEQRRLLKWKMSTVTPNVVKRVIARSHFKATKSECSQ